MPFGLHSKLETIKLSKEGTFTDSLVAESKSSCTNHLVNLSVQRKGLERN